MGYERKAVLETVGIELVSREGFNNNDAAGCCNKIYLHAGFTHSAAHKIFNINRLELPGLFPVRFAILFAEADALTDFDHAIVEGGMRFKPELVPDSPVGVRSLGKTLTL